MDIETVRRVGLARHLFELATGSLRSKNDLHLFSAVNLAQDAIETFLIALADHLQVAFDQNTKFDKYFVLIDEKIAPKKLPFKSRLLRLNRVRVDSKHHGIQPAREECERLMASAREFLDEASLSHFGATFSTISAIDLLEEGECKQLLALAKEALEHGQYESCFNAALDIALARHSNRRATRWQQPSRYYVELVKGAVPLYMKADKSSPVVATVPDGLNRLDIDYNVEGLNDDGTYWHICHLENGMFLYGLIHNDDVRSEG